MAISPPNTLCFYMRAETGGFHLSFEYRKDGSDHNLLFLSNQPYQILVFRGFTRKISMNKICQP